MIHNSTNSLAALVWFGPELLKKESGNWHTVAWRSYPSFRGRGLMKEFTKFAMDIYTKNVPDMKFWISVKKDNLGSIRLGKFLGFLKSEKISSSNISFIMIK